MINFLRYRVITLSVSLLLIGSFLGFALYKRQTTGHVFRYSVDFTGGAQVLFRFDKPVSILGVKESLDKAGWDGVSVRDFGKNEVMIRVKLESIEKDLGSVAERMETIIHDAMPDLGITMLESNTVGPEVGQSLRGKSVLATVLALLAMLLYIALRFWSLGFALGAVVALFHDALLMLAAILIFDREISIGVIGAVLTVMGYSINDTIVIFSQIRENLRKKSHESLAEIVNISLNQTIRRTLLTTISTALTVGALLVFGGEVLRDISMALMVGIVVGTYSSVYIASPIMMLLYKKPN